MKEVSALEAEKKPKTVRGKYDPSQNKYTNKYKREHYFTLRLKKEDKPEIQAAAEKLGMSMSGYITDCIYRRNREVLHSEDKEPIRTPSTKSAKIR